MLLNISNLNYNEPKTRQIFVKGLFHTQVISTVAPSTHPQSNLSFLFRLKFTQGLFGVIDQPYPGMVTITRSHVSQSCLKIMQKVWPYCLLLSFPDSSFKFQVLFNSSISPLHDFPYVKCHENDF